MDYLELKVIFNVWLAMMVYNILFKALAATLLKAILKGETGDEVRETFKERLSKKEKSSHEKV